MKTFVLYDDMKEWRDKMGKEIKKISEKQGWDYQIESYEKYDSNFKKTVANKDVSKIYLLDIDVPGSESGIDVARKIRRNDWKSIIILVTTHMELGYEALKAKIMVLDYICKYNFKEDFYRTILEGVRRLDSNSTMILESGDMTYRIYTADILYIVKDSVERKCIVKTIDHEIPVNKTMAEMGEMLDDRFYLSHRSCYINLERVAGVDWRKNTIYFEEGEKIDYLARDKKKGLKECVRSN